ncbi:restriction endonuclease [Candidatus Roizmanbacteria bacterium]|nr:restriction endonuclease [Candidatus Roizmanbacteria bacterium]
MDVVKATGEKEPFSEEKLRLSIKRAGIQDNLNAQVLAHIKTKLYDNIPTFEIYKHITEFLGSSHEPYTKTKYSLKQGIFDLGPTGFPFEDYVAEILKLEGYSVLVRQILSGKCISHEVDIVAQKNATKTVIECKFHNNPGIKCHIHVSLYTKARFDDIKDKNHLTETWLVTNTKMTSDALTYALCNNMKVISWDYPQGHSLRDLVEKYRVHPITMLTTISQAQKQQLATNHVVLAKDICKNPSTLDTLGLPKDKKNSIVTECQYVYG